MTTSHVEGERVGPWTLERKLGSGSMGEVWAASGERPDGGEGEVALKLPRRASFVRHLRREGVLLEKVQHKNVAAFIASDLESDPPWLATELVPGSPLRALCRGTIKEQHATLLADQVLAGLSAIHAAGILHLDLKPENVLVTPEGHAKIVDLGVGRAASACMAELYLSASLASRDLPLAGTLAYMAPEQRKGKAVDARADLFAFGVLLHELLSGKLPEPGRRLSFLRPALAPRWDVAVARLTHPDPAQRPASADESRQIVAFTQTEKVARPVATGGHQPRDLATFDEDAFAFESPWTPGMVVGRCELVAPLGRGGFGEVWRARRGEQEVAVKLALREDAHAALRVEAEAARRVRHHGIPSVLEDCTQDDPPHVVFQLVRGRSLRARIHDDGFVPIDEGLSVFEAMLSVVKACHAAGVVHGDLKPEHFLVDFENTDPLGKGAPHQVWLIDFGLARLAVKDGIGASLATGAKGGTFDYMAPEQRNGGGGDEPSDAYALGVCLFEIVADDLPRGTQTLTALRRECPRAIDSLARALMDENPRARPTLDRALEVVQEARRSLGATPSTRGPTVSLLRWALTTQKGCWTTVTFVAAVVLGLAMAAFVLYLILVLGH